MEEQLIPVYMTEDEYRAVIAALEAVAYDGERRTALSDGDKAPTAVFGEVGWSLTKRNGDPYVMATIRRDIDNG